MFYTRVHREKRFEAINNLFINQVSTKKHKYFKEHTGEIKRDHP